MDEATATDNCGEVVITVDEVTTAGACAGDYVITRTFTATDDCGNATSCYSDDYYCRYDISRIHIFHLTTLQSVQTITQWMLQLLQTTVERLLLL